MGFSTPMRNCKKIAQPTTGAGGPPFSPSNIYAIYGLSLAPAAALMSDLDAGAARRLVRRARRAVALRSAQGAVQALDLGLGLVSLARRLLVVRLRRRRRRRRGRRRRRRARRATLHHRVARLLHQAALARRAIRGAATLEEDEALLTPRRTPRVLHLTALFCARNFRGGNCRCPIQIPPLES